MEKRKAGRPRATDPKTFHYNFKLTTGQNDRFLKMLHEAGCEQDKTRFILSRIFG